MQGAITTLTKGLGTHLIERGIRVNAIAPGPVWTPLIQQSYPKDKVLSGLIADASSRCLGYFGCEAIALSCAYILVQSMQYRYLALQRFVSCKLQRLLRWRGHVMCKQTLCIPGILHLSIKSVLVLLGMSS